MGKCYLGLGNSFVFCLFVCFNLFDFMVVVQNLKFCQRFVLCKTHREKVFGDVLVRKQAFLENINMDLKRRKN